MDTTRRTPRYPFVAPAEVIPQLAGDKMPAEVKELSLYGCYLDTPSPLPVRTRVTVKIFGRDEFFEAIATVIYANAALGMGLVFRDVRPTYLEILRRWLVAAMQECQGERRETQNQVAKQQTPEADSPSDAPTSGDKPNGANEPT
jgi:hypothetical protein